MYSFSNSITLIVNSLLLITNFSRNHVMSIQFRSVSHDPFADEVLRRPCFEKTQLVQEKPIVSRSIELVVESSLNPGSFSKV